MTLLELKILLQKTIERRWLILMFHCIRTRYSSRFAPINDAIVRLAGCKANENKPYTIALTLYGPRNQLKKSGFRLGLYVM